MQLFGHEIGNDRRLFLIAGPCVLESEQLALDIASTLATLARRLGILVIFKASFDKANRTSRASFRGPGLDQGLEILAKVRAETGLPVLTDVHEVWQVAPVAQVADVLQIPAFLARQTDLITAAGRSGRPVNIKKGQFMAPSDMAHVRDKAARAAAEAGLGEDRFLLCERGTCFGYNNLVNDMRGLAIMADTGAPVVFDATHSVQLPSGQGDRSGGERGFVPLLSRAAVACGIAGLFLETHPDPDSALSDGPNAWPLAQMEPLIEQLLALDALIKRAPDRDPSYR
ncbi:MULTISPECIES: 3-deoxy-8-phosphooctulonate synthase [unclassified Sphingomonas]|jgi:2-dehydro-3-deoxyphosphooctonate aldolase (KDO 8-P synthase)|uniref:3-deoxy-8-phosphooctulonate synthase n=1 Tax=unclassified Sphingomonas TaxID=196159 RepID=UPI000AEF7744|nr:MULTISPECIES: 3-deoxy-8-phosphooctulonate synthase [unclassified Sphingomonas]